MSRVRAAASGDPWSAYAQAVGDRLVQARLVAGLTQREVATRAGIAVYTYRKLERGESNPGTPANPRLRTLIALASVLGVAPIDLLPPGPAGLVAAGD